MSNCPHCGKPVSIAKMPMCATSATEPRITQPENNGKPQTNGLKLVKCNRCGDGNLCWQESKNGKFYLCKARIDANGSAVPLRKEFHVCK
jgi:hypothetical protein